MFLFGKTIHQEKSTQPMISVENTEMHCTSVKSNEFKYFSFQVLNHYDIIIAVVLGLVLLVVINVVFKYFDVFNKVRCYKVMIVEEFS